MIIVGERYNSLVKIGILTANESDYFENERVGPYSVTFLTRNLNDYPVVKGRYILEKGRIELPVKIEKIYSQCCHNQIFPIQLDILPRMNGDLNIHLGDNVYFDTHFRSYLKGNITLDDLSRAYLDSLLQSLKPIKKLLSQSYNLFVPDDHDVTNEVHDILLSNNEDLKRVANFILSLVKRIYLGLRITNDSTFDYFREYQLGKETYQIVLLTRYNSASTPVPREVLPKLAAKNILLFTTYPILPFNRGEKQFKYYISYYLQSDLKKSLTDPDPFYPEEDYVIFWNELFKRENVKVISGDFHHILEAKIHDPTGRKTIPVYLFGPSKGANYKFVGLYHFRAPEGMKMDYLNFRTFYLNMIKIDVRDMKIQYEKLYQNSLTTFYGAYIESRKIYGEPIEGLPERRFS